MADAFASSSMNLVLEFGGTKIVMLFGVSREG